MSCAHITAALIQVSIVMSNMQDTATQQRAKMILLWQQQVKVCSHCGDSSVIIS